VRSSQELCLVVCLAVSTQAAGKYPFTVALDAQATAPTTTIVSRVTVRVNRLMDEGDRGRATDALKRGGYRSFLDALRALPSIGSIEVAARGVDIRYAYEHEQDGGGRRLILVADRPSFFLAGFPSRRREGYELTVVELQFDEQGGAAGTMAGAARVKTTADGTVALDDYAEAPVLLRGQGEPQR